MKVFFQLTVAVCVAAAMSGCVGKSDLRYGDKLIPDTIPWHAPGGDARKKTFLKTAESNHGYYVIYAKYIRANTQNWKDLPAGITGDFSSTVEENIICGTDKTSAADVVRVSDKDRAGLMMFTNRNLTADQLTSFQSFKGAGTPVHFISLKDPSKKDPSNSTRKCLIDSSEYAATDLMVWDRDQEIPLTVAMGHSKADISNIGNVLENVAAAANLVKSVIVPGSLVFNASGLRDVTKIGDKMDAFYERENNYFQVIGDNIKFRTKVGSDKPWTRQYIPVFYQEDDDDEATKKVAGLVEFKFTVFPTRINAPILADGYPDFEFINDSKFKEIDHQAEFTINKVRYAKEKIVTAFARWQSAYKNLANVEAFRAACDDIVGVAKNSFGYALIDQAAALDRVVSQHPKFREVIPTAEIRKPDLVMRGMLSTNNRINALKTEIANADIYIAKLKSLHAFYSIDCLKFFANGLFTRLNLPIGKRINTVSARLQSARSTKEELSNRLAEISGSENPLSRARNLVSNLMEKYLQHLPTEIERLSTEDLKSIFVNTVKVRITAEGKEEWGARFRDTKDLSLDKLSSELKHLHAWRLGCVLAGANPAVRKFVGADTEFVGVYVDHGPHVGKKGVFLIAGELSDEADVAKKKIARLEIKKASKAAVTAFDGDFYSRASTCRGNKGVIFHAKRRLITHTD